MFRILIYPSSGAWDCVVELPHRLFRSRFVVCWRFGAAGFDSNQNNKIEEGPFSNSIMEVIYRVIKIM